jgi:hypothetical protein
MAVQKFPFNKMKIIPPRGETVEVLPRSDKDVYMGTWQLQEDKIRKFLQEFIPGDADRIEKYVAYLMGGPSSSQRRIPIMPSGRPKGGSGGVAPKIEWVCWEDIEKLERAKDEKRRQGGG